MEPRCVHVHYYTGALNPHDKKLNYKCTPHYLMTIFRIADKAVSINYRKIITTYYRCTLVG